MQGLDSLTPYPKPLDTVMRFPYSLLFTKEKKSVGWARKRNANCEVGIVGEDACLEGPTDLVSR